MKLIIRMYLLLLLMMVALPITVTSAEVDERLKKIDVQGNELANDVATWAMVLDTKTGFYWEVKTLDESIHSNSARYSYNAADEEFLGELNKSSFGGFSDWRIPTEDEIYELKKKKKGDEAAINLYYFPNTIPSKYIAHGWCGSKSEYQESSVKFGKQRIKGSKYVRAVHGKSLD
jgi:hypothetical protein